MACAGHPEPILENHLRIRHAFIPVVKQAVS
jgi:hypothetical protein